MHLQMQRIEKVVSYQYEEERERGRGDTEREGRKGLCEELHTRRGRKAVSTE